MIVYADEPSDYLDSLLESIEDCEESACNSIDVVDIGEMYDASLLEEILGNCVSRRFKIDYSIRETYDQSVFARDTYTMDMYNQSLQFRMRQCLQRKLQTIKHVVGVLPFKLLGVCMTSVPKNPNYISETDAHNKAIKVLNCIKDHRGGEDKATVRRSVASYKL